MCSRLPRGFGRPLMPLNCSNKEEAVTHGNFAWHELYTRDVEAAKAFYAATVGWTFEGMPMPQQNRTYWLAKVGNKPVAGVLDMRGIVPDTDPPHWLSYLEVDDVDRLVAEVHSHGGRIVRPPFDVPDFGRIAVGARFLLTAHNLIKLGLEARDISEACVTGGGKHVAAENPRTAVDEVKSLDDSSTPPF
jgi:uncharacterized protein